MSNATSLLNRLCLWFASLLFLATTVSAQTVDRAKLLQEIIELQTTIRATTDAAQVRLLTEQLKQLERTFLAPSREDVQHFADFLKQPNTGVLRLMPRERFEGTLATRGGGAFYSFIRQEHEYGWGSDLLLERDRLRATFVVRHIGWLTTLNVPPQAVTLETPGVAWLNAFTPPLDEVGAEQQSRAAQQGVQEGGFTYGYYQPAELGRTYAMRAVKYRDSDLLVVFQLYRRDADGSLIVPWKLLRRYPTPQLNGVRFTTTSAANYVQSDFAPGSIAVAFGKDLANQGFSSDELPLPTRVAGTQVSVQDSSGRGFQLSAPLFSFLPDQVNYLIPADVVEGYGLVTVWKQSSDQTWQQYTELIRITKTAPGLFTANSDGQGVPAALLLRVDARGFLSYEQVADYDTTQKKFVPVPIDLSNATEQVFLLLFGTGLRGRSALENVSAKIGGVEAPVLYAGEQGAPGLDQINVLLPRTLAGRGEVEIVLTVDGKPANPVRLNIK